MRKPIIGVLPLVDEEKDSYWMLPGYFKGVEDAGGIPVMLPLTMDGESLKRLADLCDGFLFTGGHDVSPEMYGETPIPACGACCLQRDAMERQLFATILERDKPAFGICRGIQLFNVLLGGTLYQDLPTQHLSPIEHHQTPPYDLPVHDVKLAEGSPIARLLGKTSLSVNSYHHQAILHLAPSLRAMAYAPDGLVEAVCLPEKRFVWAVQWHPEFFVGNGEMFKNSQSESLQKMESMKIFRAFVEACEN